MTLQSELSWKRGGPHHCHQGGFHLKPWPTAQGNWRNDLHGNFPKHRVFLFQIFGLRDLLSQQLKKKKKRQNSSCICAEGISWGRKCWIIFISLCDGNKVWFCFVTFPCTSFGNHNSPVIYMSSNQDTTVTAAFPLQPPKRGEISTFSSLFAWRDASAFLWTLGCSSPNISVQPEYPVKGEGEEGQPIWTAGALHIWGAVPLQVEPPPQSFVSHESTRKSPAKLGAGGPGICPVFDITVLQSALKSEIYKLKKAHYYHRYFLFKWLPFHLARQRELLVLTGNWKRYWSEYFPSDYSNFPLLLSKIIVINLKVEGGGFLAGAKLPRPLASAKKQRFTSAEDTDWACLIL